MTPPRHEEDDNYEGTETPQQRFVLQGFAIRTWSDLLAAMSLLGMLIAGVAWGLKLEGDNEVLRTLVQAQNSRITQAEAAIASGVLPLTGERFERMNDRIKNIESMMERHITEHDAADGRTRRDAQIEH